MGAVHTEADDFKAKTELMRNNVQSVFHFSFK